MVIWLISVAKFISYKRSIVLYITNAIFVLMLLFVEIDLISF